MAALTLSTDAAVRALQDRSGRHRRALPLRVDDRRASTSPACAACWPTTCGRSTATPIRSSAATRVARWIAEATATVVWQHHLLSVYHVDVDGDDAKALVYHTSHQVFEDAPDTAKLLVGRYHLELRREPGGWRISRLVLEILWGEEKTDATGYLALIGGRGPQG